MRFVVIIIMFVIGVNAYSQRFFTYSYDTVKVADTDYIEGLQWAYYKKSDVIVGATCDIVDTEIGSCYQISIYVRNEGKTKFNVCPDSVTCVINSKQNIEKLNVISSKEYERKVRNRQSWAMALYGVANGLSASSSFFDNGYSSTTAAVNISNSIQLVTLGNVMRHELRESLQGYLKKNTLYPHTSLVGVLLVKEKKGTVMSVDMTVGGQKFTFNWNVEEDVTDEFAGLYVFYD